MCEYAAIHIKKTVCLGHRRHSSVDTAAYTRNRKKYTAANGSPSIHEDMTRLWRASSFFGHAVYKTHATECNDTARDIAAFVLQHATFFPPHL